MKKGLVEKISHCCELMDININDGRVQIFYDEVNRDYYIPLIDVDNKITAIQGLFHCPWCAKNYPKVYQHYIIKLLETNSE